MTSDRPTCAVTGCRSFAKRGRSYCSTHTTVAERERFLQARAPLTDADRREPEMYDPGWLYDTDAGPVPVLSSGQRPDGLRYVSLLHHSKPLYVEPGVEPPIRYDKDLWLRLMHPNMRPEVRERLVAADRTIHHEGA